MRFTDKSVAAIRRKDHRFEVWDEGRSGFGLRVSPAERKTWVLMYRAAGRARRMTLGSYPLVGLADARLAAAKARKALEKGIDPGSQAIMARHAERAAATIDELIEDYLRHHARVRKAPASAYQDERMLNKDVRPAWGACKAKSIVRRDVIHLLDGIVARGAPSAANHTLAVVRKMFNFAIERDILAANPCAMMRPPGVRRPRDRVLSDEEVRSLWTGLPGADEAVAVEAARRFMAATGRRRGEVAGAAWREFDLRRNLWTIPSERAKSGAMETVRLSALARQALDDARRCSAGGSLAFAAPHRSEPPASMLPRIALALKFMLVTGQRRGEVAKAEWAEFDEAAGTWTIPAAKTKNRQPHIVPLSRLARRVLKDVRTLSDSSRWLFPSPRRDGTLDEHSITQAYADCRERLRLGDSRPHDLRRTAATRMSELGILRFIVKRVLNHADRDVTDIYDRYGYLPEKRQALEAWADRLEAIVAARTATVVKLRPRRRPVKPLSSSEARIG